MKEGIEQCSVTFHERARNVFFPLYQEFRQASKLLDRQRDENVYQQLQTKFVNHLHQRLNNIALEMLNQLEPNQNRNKLNQLLGNAIEEYVKEFMLKARSQ